MSLTLTVPHPTIPTILRYPCGDWALFDEGIDIATFGILRDHIAVTHGLAPPAFLLMGAGMLSSTTAQLVAYPLGLIRTRMQVPYVTHSIPCAPRSHTTGPGHVTHLPVPCVKYP